MRRPASNQPRATDPVPIQGEDVQSTERLKALVSEGLENLQPGLSAREMIVKLRERHAGKFGPKLSA